MSIHFMAVLVVIATFAVCVYVLGAVKLYLPRAPYMQKPDEWSAIKTWFVLLSTVLWPLVLPIVSLYRFTVKAHKFIKFQRAFLREQLRPLLDTED